MATVRIDMYMVNCDREFGIKREKEGKGASEEVAGIKQAADMC